jgi:hypothetical protein
MVPFVESPTPYDKLVADSHNSRMSLAVRGKSSTLPKVSRNISSLPHDELIRCKPVDEEFQRELSSAFDSDATFVRLFSELNVF